MRRRRIAFIDTCLELVETDLGAILILFDANDKPIYKLALAEADELIQEVLAAPDLPRAPKGSLWRPENYEAVVTRRVQRLLYERAVTDGAFIDPERMISHACN